ncbi:DUF6445 family protein [Roseibium sp. RKSG952]|uniref:DUF6445 family protein n=1 Tax=Roseibium sp. RKSG952 TaxID=2529384 RepID=UPI0012BBC63A|nr:DUF6445 family protein [Roseibium sp. RKSG952]MTH98171.1 hypothetical protein [Roseibium sp. RKSG952]
MLKTAVLKKTADASSDRSMDWRTSFADLLSPSGRWDISERVVDDLPIVIIDDALKQPEALRDFALGLDYGILQHAREYRNYPGERAIVSIEPKALRTRILKAYPFHKQSRLNPALEFRREAAIFTRILPSALKALHPRQKAPHLDIGTMLVGLLHLTPPGDEPGATGFYRHKQTGLAFMPNCPDEDLARCCTDLGYSPYDAHGYMAFRKHLIYDQLGSYAHQLQGTGIDRSNDVWELVHTIPGRFNRLVVFPANLFHSPVFFTGSHNRPRLTMNMNFDPI